MAARNFEKEIRQLKRALKRVKSEECWPYYSYYPFVISHCKPNKSISFPRVEIWLEDFVEVFSSEGQEDEGICPYLRLSSLMESGLLHLENFLEKDGELTPEILCLLSFLKEKEKHSNTLLQLFEGCEVQDRTVVTMAVHLFSRLYPRHDFALDTKQKLNTCPCSCVSVEENLGESTGLGSAEVWHGQTDILLHSRFSVPVTVTVDQASCSDDSITDDLNDSTGPSCDYDGIQTEGTVGIKDTLDSRGITSQIISQTIVNSFTNAAKSNRSTGEHTEVDESIFPGLGCTRDQVSVCYFDCKKDLLIGRGSHIDIWETKKGTSTPTQTVLSVSAILEIWLILNFPPELPDEALNCFPKSKFFNFVSEKSLKCYKKSEIGTSVSTGREHEDDIYERKQFIDAPRKFGWCTFKECKQEN